MNSGLNWLVALVMVVSLSACATNGLSPADTAAGQPTGAAVPAAEAQPASKPVIGDEPGCD